MLGTVISSILLYYNSTRSFQFLFTHLSVFLQVHFFFKHNTCTQNLTKCLLCYIYLSFSGFCTCTQVMCSIKQQQGQVPQISLSLSSLKQNITMCLLHFKDLTNTMLQGLIWKSIFKSSASSFAFHFDGNPSCSHFHQYCPLQAHE